MPEKQNSWFLNEKVGIDKYGAVVGMVPLQCYRTSTVMTCPALKKKSWKSSEFLKDLCDWNKKTCLIVETQSSLHDPGVGCPERTAWPALLPRCAALRSCHACQRCWPGSSLPFMYSEWHCPSFVYRITGAVLCAVLKGLPAPPSPPVADPGLRAQAPFLLCLLRVNLIMFSHHLLFLVYFSD